MGRGIGAALSSVIGRCRMRPAHPFTPAIHRMPTTDYIRHAARLARKVHMDAAMGGTPQPDGEFFKTLAKALEEIAAGLEQVAKRE